MSKTYRLYKNEPGYFGPFKLLADITEEIRDSDIGVYILTATGNRGGEIVVYIGSGNLNDRLTVHAKNKDGKQFYYKLTMNEDERFKEERRLYFKYGEEEHLNNKITPPSHDK